MNIRSQTPLSQLVTDSSLKEALSRLWIASVEELVAMVSAIEKQPQLLEGPVFGQGRLSSAINEAKAVLPSERLSVLSGARAGGSLGCLLDPQVLEDFHRKGRLTPRLARPKGAFEAKLPASIRLMDSMPPVRNQGQRGTCVAFGTLALREFLIGTGIDLSEQFLYWACKELDRYPGPGTYVHTAMTALAEYGTCEESVWPYNPNQIENNEGQGPPPEGADKNAKKYILASTRTVEPNLVIHYKNVLAGDTGKGGMPVTFATLVFNSWYMSTETNRTGKITLPLPGEEPVGGHAWCVVGYVDDDDVPGGGYFIVRNSWGTQWAPDSPEAPGHAVMPYEYVERYAVEAFTGPGVLHEAQGPVVKDSLSHYIRELKTPTRDIESKLLRAGTAVLFNPSEPDVIMEDTPVNRTIFIQQDCAWTVKARVRVWFPEKDKTPGELTDKLKDAQSTKQQFCAALEENLVTSVRQPFPEVHQPIVHKLLPWEPRIHRVGKIADLGEELTGRIRQACGVPSELLQSLPGYWLEAIKSMNQMVVYNIGSLMAEVHVVVVFATSLQFRKNAPPVLKSPDMAIIEMVQSIYGHWLKTTHVKKPIFTFFTLGSPQKWTAEVQGLASGGYWVICSSPAADGRWEARQPPRFADRFSLAEFKDRLLPETRQQRISRIKAFVDDKLDSGYDGHLDLEKIYRGSKEAGFDYRRSAIRDAMASMQERAGYRIYRTSDSGILAIDRNTGRRGVKIRSISETQKKIKRIALMAIIGLGGGLITQMVHWGFGGTQFNWSSVGVSAITTYLVGVFTKRVGRLIE